MQSRGTLWHNRKNSDMAPTSISSKLHHSTHPHIRESIECVSFGYKQKIKSDFEGIERYMKLEFDGSQAN